MASVERAALAVDLVARLADHLFHLLAGARLPVQVAHHLRARLDVVQDVDVGLTVGPQQQALGLDRILGAEHRWRLPGRTRCLSPWDRRPVGHLCLMFADAARAVAADPNPAGTVAARRGAKDERFQCHPYPVLHGAGFQTSPGKARSGRLGVRAQVAGARPLPPASRRRLRRSGCRRPSRALRSGSGVARGRGSGGRRPSPGRPRRRAECAIPGGSHRPAARWDSRCRRRARGCPARSRARCRTAGWCRASRRSAAGARARSPTPRR